MKLLIRYQQKEILTFVKTVSQTLFSVYLYIIRQVHLIENIHNNYYAIIHETNKGRSELACFRLTMELY